MRSRVSDWRKFCRKIAPEVYIGVPLSLLSARLCMCRVKLQNARQKKTGEFESEHFLELTQDWETFKM